MCVGVSACESKCPGTAESLLTEVQPVDSYLVWKLKAEPGFSARRVLT